MRLNYSMLALMAGAIAPLCAADPGTTYAPTGPAQDRPMLGVQMSPVPLPTQEQEGLTPNEGVYVQSVYGNTAASNMGLQAGDVILGVNGAQISNMNDLRNEVALNQVGDPVDVTIERQGQTLTATSTFQPWPSNIPYEPIDPAMEQNFRNWQENRLNQLAQEANDMQNQAGALAKQMGLDPKGNPLQATQGNEATGLDALAWRFRYDLTQAAGSKTTPPTTTAEPVVDDAVAYGVSIPVPWHFVWQVSSASPQSSH